MRQEKEEFALVFDSFSYICLFTVKFYNAEPCLHTNRILPSLLGSGHQHC